jgi:hypothetical protein
MVVGSVLVIATWRSERTTTTIELPNNNTMKLVLREPPASRKHFVDRFAEVLYFFGIVLGVLSKYHHNRYKNASTVLTPVIAVVIALTLFSMMQSLHKINLLTFACSYLIGLVCSVNN